VKQITIDIVGKFVILVACICNAVIIVYTDLDGSVVQR